MYTCAYQRGGGGVATERMRGVATNMPFHIWTSCVHEDILLNKNIPAAYI